MTDSKLGKAHYNLKNGRVKRKERRRRLKAELIEIRGGEEKNNSNLTTTTFTHQTV